MSTLKADTIQSTGGGAATLTKQSASKAFLRFNQATPETLASFGVSSTTDVGSNESDANFTTAFTSVNFIANGNSHSTTATSYARYIISPPPQSSTVCTIYNYTTSGGADCIFMASFNGDLA